MKKLIYALLCALTITMVSCFASYASTDDVYYNDGATVEIIVSQGTPVYHNGNIWYYVYNNLYYYPFFYENHWYFRPYTRIYPYGYDFHFRPHRNDYRFNPGNYGFNYPPGRRPRGAQPGGNTRPVTPNHRPHRTDVTPIRPNTSTHVEKPSVRPNHNGGAMSRPHNNSGGRVNRSHSNGGAMSRPSSGATRRR